MALYLISYDLLNKKTFGDYEKLIAELRRIGAKEVLFSEWVWKRENYSCAQMRDHLKTFIHPDDRILVTEVSDWASRGTMIDINDL
jgi:hypothetical protein